MNLKFIGFLFGLICSTNIFGQYVLGTPDGKKVELKSDGTWTFVNQSNTDKSKLIPKGSTSKYTSRFKKYELWYDPAQWFFDTSKITNSYTWDANIYSVDYAIQGYCMDSRLSMSVENIEESIRQQWQSKGEVKSFKQYNDTINNLPLIIYEIQLLYNGLTYQYKGLVYSTLKGSFQLTVGTQKEIFEEDKSKIDLLLKGLTKL